MRSTDIDSHFTPTGMHLGQILNERRRKSMNTIFYQIILKGGPVCDQQIRDVKRNLIIDLTKQRQKICQHNNQAFMSTECNTHLLDLKGVDGRAEMPLIVMTCLRIGDYCSFQNCIVLFALTVPSPIYISNLKFFVTLHPPDTNAG